MKVDRSVLYRLIGSRLREQRLGLGLTQEQVAGQTGFERTSITNIEKGRQQLPLHALYDLCSALETEVGAVIPSIHEVFDGGGSSLAAGYKGSGEGAPTEAADLVQHLRRRVTQEDVK